MNGSRPLQYINNQSFSFNIECQNCFPYTSNLRFQSFANNLISLFIPFHIWNPLLSSQLTMHPLILFLPFFITSSVAYLGDIRPHHFKGKSTNLCHQPTHDLVVGISKEMMDTSPNTNPADNRRCGSLITIWNPRTRKSWEAVVVDVCEKCNLMDLAVTKGLFNKIAPYNRGGEVTHEIAWGGNEVGGWRVMRARMRVFLRDFINGWKNKKLSRCRFRERSSLEFAAAEFGFVIERFCHGIG